MLSIRSLLLPLLFAASISHAFAAKDNSYSTSGNFIGISGNFINTRFHEIDYGNSNGSATPMKPSASENGYGVGINYKYALNYNGFFVAPGFILEKYWNSVDGSDKIGTTGRYDDITRLDVRDRIAVTTDIGYDFNRFFSGYVMGGYGSTGYRVENGFAASNSVYDSILDDARKRSFIFGGGFNVRINKAFVINIEANTQDFDVETNTNSPLQFKTDIMAKGIMLADTAS